MTDTVSSRQAVLATITIGQAPRTDITHDILPLMPPGMTLREYGALDDYTLEEIQAQFSPQPGDEVLVSRMRDGRQAHFADRYIIPLVQQKIDQAEAEGADAVILFCTGYFPPFRHRGLFLEPQPLLHAVASKLADGKKIGLLVPMPDQVQQGRESWGRSGLSVEVACASPYLDFEKIKEAAATFRDKDLAFVCADCMGYSAEMKAAICDITGLPVLLPRTLVMRVLSELFT
ncbi:MAG: AroM family protein [Lachnospiraceae bacterium]|nr:AroM family protein [Lachnospiraceae bacterium]